MVREEDRSGRYVRMRRDTFYCEATSRFLRLDAAAVKAVLAGRPVRVSPAAFS